jgi:uncharacterized protein (DUF885 family)
MSELNAATRQFQVIATKAIDDLLSFDPVFATYLGDHRFDDRLPAMTSVSREQQARQIADHLTELDAVDDLELSASDQIDLEILRSRLTKSQFEVSELRAATWNPMVWNPGTALHLLVSRDFAPKPERARSVKARLAAIPGFLADARFELVEMTQIHTETAITQLAGTARLIETEVAELVDDAELVSTARAAVTEFSDWLTEQLPEARRSPRLGARLYEATLWHGLDDGTSPIMLLEAAEAHLEKVNLALQGYAAQYLGEKATTPGLVHRAFARIAAQAPVTNETVLEIVEQALVRTTEFVRTKDLISIPELDVRVIEMPEIHRGVAVAYCDAPGPLETAQVATFVAVSPTPNDWTIERVDSFYREYNAVQLHGLTIHEAMPGHVLQLAQSHHFEATTPVRAFARSGVFIEGWAVYSEELLVSHGYAPFDDKTSALALRLQQLKMQARLTINAILDVRVHTAEMTEQEGLDLMMNRGFQEEGEAIGKWRRALLTAGQLPTYFAGYRALSEIVADLRVLHPDWSDRQIHDLVLAYGAPAPRYLREFLGI